MKEISRRDFLRWAAMAGGGTLLAACSPLPEITPIPLPRPLPLPTREAAPILSPTPIPRGEPTQTRIPEPTPTPEITPKLLERIKVDIPGLTVERYTVRFPEITNKVPESYKEDLKRWIAQPGPLSLRENNSAWKGPWWFFDQYYTLPVLRCDPSLLAWGEIIPNNGALYFYFDGQNRFYSLGIPRRSISRTDEISNEDRQILGWQRESDSIYRTLVSSRTYISNLSCDGKILYDVNESKERDRYATILADVPKRTKIVIRDSGSQDITSALSGNGNKIALSFDDDFPYKRNPKRGTYLIDLDSWQMRFQLDRHSRTIFLNENGNLLYEYRFDQGNPERTGYLYAGYIHNTLTGEKRFIGWPNYLMKESGLIQVFNPHGEHFASPNLNFIVRLLGMSPTAGDVDRSEGVWGISAHTPERHLIVSSPGWSLKPTMVDNDGTIYTSRGDVLKFEEGTYKLVKIGPETEAKIKKDGKPIEVRVWKAAHP